MQNSKTAVLYDPNTLLHRCGREHPERPKRVSSIISHLKTKKLLDDPQVKFIQKLEQASQDVISLVHTEKYMNYVNTLWSKTTSKSHVMVLDTYFNKYTNEASNLAVSGVIEGVQGIMKKQWKNAFAIVRPPGHHSGQRNVINGFCIYNNVAIGVQYLRKHYNMKKIAIFDWDVHHGDGTQYIFREDPDLLFISLHRHDRGSFYPGQSGSYKNAGQGPAEGFQINISWNVCDQKYKPYKETPGDNEYIYIFERMLQPILKEFKPEFIFISSGFDSARGDPLGGISVGPEAYHYLTTKLMKIAPLIVVLEGGYNLKSISWAAQSVLCALLGRPGPRQTQFTPEQLKAKCCLPQQYHENLDMIISYFKKWWPLLNSAELTDYEKTIKDNKNKQFASLDESSSDSSESEVDDLITRAVIDKNNEQTKEKISSMKEIPPFSENSEELKKLHSKYTVHEENQQKMQYYLASGHVTDIRFVDNRLIKTSKGRSEVDFYQSDFPEKALAPKFIGIICQNDIVMQNLLYGLTDISVIDVKMGKTDGNTKLSQEKLKKQQRKNQISSSGELGFRIVGLVTPQLKQYGLLFKDHELIRKVLRKVVTKQNKQQILEFLRKMQEILKSVKRHYHSTSILIIKAKEETRIRWVDFHYWHEETTYDETMVWAVDNLASFIDKLQDLEEHA